MEDSETKIEEKAGEEKTPAVSIEMVRHNGKDKLTKRIRGEGGKFQKQPKSMPKTVDVVREWRKLMLQPLADENGKLTKGGRARVREVFDRLYSNAIMSPEQPVIDKLGNVVYTINDKGEKVPLTTKDPKVMMASKENAKELMLRTWGMYAKSDEEIEALKTQAVKVLVLQHPDMMDKNVYEEKPKEALKPAFIDAEIVENK
jgi:hypothetical protein